MKKQLIGLFLGSALSATAFAAGSSINPVLDDQFTFQLGATFLDIDGAFSSTLDGEPTDSLSTSDLGISDGSTSPYFGFRWRFTDRWHLGVDYFSLDETGSVSRDFGDFNFGDISATGTLGVDTDFDTDFYVVRFGYSIFKDERSELGLGLGLHVVDFTTRLTVSGTINGMGGSIASDSTDLTAPLPNIIGFGTYAFSPRLSLGGSIGWFGLDYDEYDGSLITLATNIEYRLTDNFGVGAGYNYVDMDLDIDESGRTDNYNIEYQGPFLFLSAGF